MCITRSGCRVRDRFGLRTPFPSERTDNVHVNRVLVIFVSSSRFVWSFRCLILLKNYRSRIIHDLAHKFNGITVMVSGRFRWDGRKKRPFILSNYELMSKRTKKRSLGRLDITTSPNHRKIINPRPATATKIQIPE